MKAGLDEGAAYVSYDDQQAREVAAWRERRDATRGA